MHKPVFVVSTVSETLSVFLYCFLFLFLRLDDPGLDLSSCLLIPSCLCSDLLSSPSSEF